MQENLVYLVFLFYAIVGAAGQLMLTDPDWKNKDLMSWAKVLFSGFVAGSIIIGAGYVNGPMFHGDVVLLGLAVGFSCDRIVSRFIVNTRKKGLSTGPDE